MLKIWEPGRYFLEGCNRSLHLCRSPFFFILFIAFQSSTFELVSASKDIFISVGGFNSSNIRCSPGVGSDGILQIAPSADTGPGVSAGRCLFDGTVSLLDDSSTRVSSFSTTFTFSMFNADAAQNGPRSNSALIGFAFILVAEARPEVGYNATVPDPCCREPLQYLGILNEISNGKNSSNTFAVEFDVYNPSMSSMFSDPPHDHVGININSMNSSLKARAGTYIENLSCQTSPHVTSHRFVPVNLSDGKLIQAWIDYRGDTGQLDVSISSQLGTKPTKSLLNGLVDLGSVVQENMYVGFSSAGYSDGDKTPSLIYDWSFSAGEGKAHLLYRESVDSRCSGTPAFSRSVRSNLAGIYVTAISCLAVIVCVFCLAGTFLIRRKRALRKEFQVLELENLEYGPIKYNFRALRAATDGFDGSHRLGSGEQGTFYRAVLGGSGREVAVKRIPLSSRVNESDFVADLRVIGRLRHRNLVELQGWCYHKHDLLLVYEFLPYGSLDRFLFKDEAKTLSWSQRMHVLKGVAAALVYLHEECELEKPIVHGNVKASNVMLDSEYNARLGEFGLTKLLEEGDHGADGIVVAGSARHQLPRVKAGGNLTDKSDVQSFGTLVLRVVSGRRPVEAAGLLPLEHSFVRWVLSFYQEGKLSDLVDQRLGCDYSEDEVVQILEIGLLCSHPDESQRPSMRRVKQMLSGELAIPPLPSFKPEGPLASVHLDWDDSPLEYSTPEIGMIDSPEMGLIASFKDIMGPRASSRDSMGKRSRSCGS